MLQGYEQQMPSGRGSASQPAHTAPSGTRAPAPAFVGRGSKYKYCRGIKNSRWWQQDLMRSGSGTGIHLVAALITRPSGEREVQASSTA